MSGGEGSVGGTVVGAILIATIRNGGVLLGLNGQIIEIVIGCLIVGAVLIDSLSKKRAK
jgi:ribose transport system permease protein